MSILTVLIARNPRDQRCPRTALQRLCQSPMLPLGRGFSRPCTQPRGRGQQEADAPDTAPWKHLGGSTSKLSPRCFHILTLYLFMDFGCHGNVRLPPSLVPPKGKPLSTHRHAPPRSAKGGTGLFVCCLNLPPKAMTHLRMRRFLLTLYSKELDSPKSHSKAL